MRCPNGCQEPLERVDFPAHYDPVRREWVPPAAEYHCPECDWQARWEKGKGLTVLFPGVGRVEEEFWL